jgi:hypothetical protein
MGDMLINLDFSSITMSNDDPSSFWNHALLDAPISQTDRLEYFTMFDDEEPVSVATLANFAGIGYISNVGSKLDYRGKGFEKVISLYCVYKSK